MPLSAFGYVRIAADIPEGDTRQDPRRIVDEYAKREGYILARVFTEGPESGSSAFAALMDALYLSDHPVVIVPSIGHFAYLAGLQQAMKDRIEMETGALVVVIQGRYKDTEKLAGESAPAIGSDFGIAK
jgi:hypothetical protein